jgi:transposase
MLAAGERVADVQPKLSARVRLLAAGATSKNDPNDARSVAAVAVRSPAARPAAADDHAAVLRVWSKRHRDLGRLRTQLVCRLHAVLCELLPGGVATKMTAGQAAQLLGPVTTSGAVAAARRELAAQFTAGLRGTGAQMRDT